MVRSEMDSSAPEPALETRLATIEARTLALEERVAALEGKAPETAAEGPEGRMPTPREEVQALFPSAASVVALVGRACLVLGGAFLIRTATDSGLLPPLAGVGLALLYCVLWAALADRAGRKGQRLWAGFQLLTAALIALPMLWETTQRYHFLPPAGSAAALLLITLLLVGVAIRQGLAKVAWLVLLSALFTGFILMAATSAITSFCAFFILLGGTALAVSDREAWRGLRWPAALGADLAVAIMTLLALSPGSDVLRNDLRVARVLTLAIALVGVYLGGILYRTLKRPRAVGPFEVFQAFAVLAVGYGGAIRVAQAGGAGVAILGTAALVLGLGCYACAFAFVERQAEGSLDFPFLTALALMLLLAGSLLLLSPTAMALLWVGLGLASLRLGMRFPASPLDLQGALYLGAAASASGLLASAWAALVAKEAPALQAFSLAGLVTLAALGLVQVLPFKGPDRPALPLRSRLAALATGALAVFALGGLLVSLLGPLAKGDPGALAAARTAVLVGLALATAAMGRWQPGSVLPWFRFPLLGLTALKILLEDFPHGRPATLFLALTLLGCGLLAVGRFARDEKKARG